MNIALTFLSAVIMVGLAMLDARVSKIEAMLKFTYREDVLKKQEYGNPIETDE